mmetsp:Transcript_12444/g.28637  ORF Transcript_12444/g.28637 Transcript_12444/m.28637 type:complete len:115 (-) Transcript_12444:511-855(-)
MISRFVFTDLRHAYASLNDFRRYIWKLRKFCDDLIVFLESQCLAGGSCDYELILPKGASTAIEAIDKPSEALYRPSRWACTAPALGNDLAVDADLCFDRFKLGRSEHVGVIFLP